MTVPYHVRSVEPLADFCLRVTFADGSGGDVDFNLYLENPGPVYQPLRDPAFFAQVFVDEELGTVVWPNGADFAPEVLHELANR